MAQQLVAANVATAKAVLPEGARAVTAEDNLFDQKSHANPLARLMEIVANSVEHGGASHVALEFRRGFYSVTETDGIGLDYEGLFGAMGKFGGHQARDEADVKLKHFSHNGIGTKSPMSIFANQLVLSRKGSVYALAMLSRGRGPHVLGAQWNSREAFARGAAGATSPQMVEQIQRCAAPVISDVFAEFGKIGGSGGCRWCYFTVPNTRRPRFRVGAAVEALFADGHSYTARVEQVIDRNGQVEAYVVQWDDGAKSSRVTPQHVTPIGGWPEDALEALDGDVVTRGADPKRDRGVAWTTSLSARLQLFMAEPRGVSITLNGSEIVPISCEELLETLEEMPLFEDANRLLAQAKEARSTGSAFGGQTEQEAKLSIDEPFASGRADPAIYESGSYSSAVGTAGCDASTADDESVRASVMKMGRPTMIYRGANGVRARLRLGRVAANRKGTQTGGQLFLDTVYAASDRTEGFKGGFIVYFNGVHIPIPDQLMWLGAAARFNDGGRRLGGRVHGCLELHCLEDSLLSSGKEKLDERHPWFEKCKQWLEYRLDFYLKALAFVDRPEKIKRQSGGKNKEYIEAAMTCARLHIAPTRLSQVEKEAKQQRTDAAAALDGLQLSNLQTAAGARIRKKPQRLEAELSIEPSCKRVKRNTPKPTTAALKRSEETNERLKAKLKDAHAKIKALEDQVEQLQGQILQQGRMLKLTSSKALQSTSPPTATAAAADYETRKGMDCAPDPRLMITATRSQPAPGGIQDLSKTLSVTPTDQYGNNEDCYRNGTVSQRWQPDAIELAIRQWWHTLEEHLQNVLDADDLGIYASCESRGIGEEQTGAEWWATFSSYSENDLKDLFYKEGTVLHDGQRCGKDEVKLKMKDRKILGRAKVVLEETLKPLLPQHIKNGEK